MKKLSAGGRVAALLVAVLLAGGVGIAISTGSVRVAAQAVPTATLPPPTDTPASTATPAPNWPGPAHTIQISSDPDEVVCDGQHAAQISVRLLDASVSPVADGTPVYFAISQGFVASGVATTLDGYANGAAYPNNSGGYGAVQVQVDAGRIEVFIRVLCTPPAMSPPPPPCPTPQSPPQCDAPMSPPCPPSPPQCDGPMSPPCAPSPPQCSGVVSPPCATATPTPQPPSPPQCGGVTSPPCTAPTATPVPEACADVTGDHRVDLRDVLAISRHMSTHHADLRYDLNHDGVVDLRDVQIAIRQFGRRC